MAKKKENGLGMTKEKTRTGKKTMLPERQKEIFIIFLLMQKFVEQENIIVAPKQETGKNIMPQPRALQKENKAEPTNLEKRKALGHTTRKAEEELEKEHIKTMQNKENGQRAQTQTLPLVFMGLDCIQMAKKTENGTMLLQEKIQQ